MFPQSCQETCTCPGAPANCIKPGKADQLDPSETYPLRSSEVLQNFHRAQRSSGMKRQEPEAQVSKMTHPQIVNQYLTQKEEVSLGTEENGSMKKQLQSKLRTEILSQCLAFYSFIKRLVLTSHSLLSCKPSGGRGGEDERSPHRCAPLSMSCKSCFSSEIPVTPSVPGCNLCHTALDTSLIYFSICKESYHPLPLEVVSWQSETGVD